MGRSIRFFTSSGSGSGSGCSSFEGTGVFGKHSSLTSLSGAKASRSSPSKQKLDALRTRASSASTASTGESSSTSYDDISVTSPLCTTAKENDSISQRLTVRANGETWNVSPRRGGPIASLRFPSHRDEMFLYDGNEQSCGVILPSTSSPCRSTTDGCYEYTLYSFEPCSEKQAPAAITIAGTERLFLYARIRAEQVFGMGDCTCYNFTCHTETQRQFTADKVLWSTFQSKAFCVKETTMGQDAANAARITCLTETDREVMVYPRVDPMLVLGFVAVMEEVVLLTNL